MIYQDWSDDDAYDAAESRGEAYAEQLREWADNERKRRREKSRALSRQRGKPCRMKTHRSY